MALWSALMLVAQALLGNSAQDGPNFRDRIGGDFLAYYSAGTFLRTGRSAELYDVPAVAAFQKSLASDVPVAQLGVAPWWNPPQFALPFAAMSGLKFHHALYVWYAFLLAALVLSIKVMSRVLQEPTIAFPRELHQRDLHQRDLATRNFSSLALLSVLILAAPVTIQALAHGQSTTISLLIVSAVVLMSLQGRALTCGLLLSVLFYKPQLAAVLSIVVVILLGRRALLGLLIGGLLQLTIVLLVIPGTLERFLFDMPAALIAFQTQGQYTWHRHATTLSLFRIMFQGDQVGPNSPIVVWLSGLMSVAIGIAVMTIAANRRSDRRCDRRLVLAVAILATPLILPFYFDYDLMLLFVSGVLVASMIRDKTLATAMIPSRLIFVTAGALYLSLQIDLAAIGIDRINIRAILLLGLLTMLLRAARTTSVIRSASNAVRTDCRITPAKA